MPAEGRGGCQVALSREISAFAQEKEEQMQTKIDRIRELSQENRNCKFVSLYHLINEQLLLECYWELDPDKATGIDGVDKELYGENVSGNIMELVDKLRNRSFQPKPTKRVYIPKDNWGRRPLGILSLEDKMVQMALAKIIGAIYEPVFLDCMYGFRPARGCHDALRALNWVIEKKKTQWVLDADIKSYFDQIPHKKLLDCLKVKIKDPNILWLVKKYLKAGVMENGKYSRTEWGTIQGGNISPILANVYMHYMLTLWFYQRERHTFQGEGWLVNFADDFIACFSEKEDAEKFYADLKRRLSDFGLMLQEEKTKLIEFGSRAQASREAKGENKPETFDFLGFTHYCSKSQKGWFRVKRRTSRKKFRKKVTEMGQWLKKNRGMKVSLLIKKVNQKLRGHYQYYGITDNSRMLVQYCYETRKALFKWLNRRSQRRSYTWEEFNELLKYCPLEQPKIYHSIYKTATQT